MSHERCQNCGNHYLAVYSVPDSVWEKVSPRRSHGGLLCLDCCDNLARDMGLSITWEGKVGRSLGGDSREGSHEHEALRDHRVSHND